MNPLDFAFILLRNTPWWVFLIFAWLLWLGWRGLRTRAVRLPLLAIDPALLLALTVPDLVQRAGGAEWRQIGVWIGAAALGAAVGHITLRHLRLRALPEKRSIIVPGSVIPLAFTWRFSRRTTISAISSGDIPVSKTMPRRRYCNWRLEAHSLGS